MTGKLTKELRDDLNDSISDGEIVEMLAQHLITKPVFDALFDKYSFASRNPISKAMQGVLDALQEHRLEKEADTLDAFYESVKFRAEGIDSATGKQKIVVELYDKFFRNAFPRMTERLGIVYTPVEVVDFIIHSVAHVLQSEFGQTLGSKGVHIIDPFTGTGTFITRLLQSGLIKPEELPHKYKHEIHANEIVLLAYYIAAINIEAVYHAVVGGDYEPFEGICLTDTFQMYEKDDLVGALMVDNSKRRKRQKTLDIRVIMANPPYSDGQDSANDINENIEYSQLDARIRSTYAERSSIRMVRSLYNSYIRAIRWATDRLGDAGVIGFVTNAGFLNAISADGMRRCLAEDFSNIYIFHLRGNARTVGEQRRKEKDNVFGAGSRAPVAISLLVKNPAAKQSGQIYFHDIGDYLSREDKLAKVVDYGSIAGVSSSQAWRSIAPDSHGDWLQQRDSRFNQYIALGDKKAQQPCLFTTFTNGVKSNRDAWVFNGSRSRLQSNINRMTIFFNEVAKRLANARKQNREVRGEEFIKIDRAEISWADDLKRTLESGRFLSVDPTAFVPSLYRPFNKQWLYMDRKYLWSLYLTPLMFAKERDDNRLICLSGPGNKGNFSVLITDIVPSLHVADIDGSQCFPLYVYDIEDKNPEVTEKQQTLMLTEEANSDAPKRRDGVTDEGLAHFSAAYPRDAITKEDIFYYVYGLLHSPDYRERFADNLGKELPRIPCVKTAADFRAFSQAGRDLARLHLEYESVPEYPAKIDSGSKRLTSADYHVEKMKFGKSGKDKDRTTIHYNDHITVSGIPLEAYDYVVNGKPAIEWVMERQCVKTDKDSGIINDANDWAAETMGNPRYPLELLLRVVTVSLETMKIIQGLPELRI